MAVGGHARKLFGRFRGAGLDNTGGFFERLGFRLGRGFAGAAGLTELTAGLLIALGFLGPVGPALLLSVMVVPVITVNWRNGLLATSNGSELPLLYITAARLIWAVLAGGALAGLTNVLAARQRVPSRAPLSR